eukprot:TRINITY_DN707_c0_g1_i5.p1 TRINITY_DN707_c0_g1~~TRINITY_DN707_c0_g1_i5.p1  ORF type:complete len:2532 (-),score=631.38 TRINITY_DN707_c0_g1_i5:1348-8943(-)
MDAPTSEEARAKAKAKSSASSEEEEEDSEMSEKETAKKSTSPRKTPKKAEDVGEMEAEEEEEEKEKEKEEKQTPTKGTPGKKTPKKQTEEEKKKKEKVVEGKGGKESEEEKEEEEEEEEKEEEEKEEEEKEEEAEKEEEEEKEKKEEDEEKETEKEKDKKKDEESVFDKLGRSGDATRSLRKPEEKILTMDQWRNIECKAGIAIAIRCPPDDPDKFYVALLQQDLTRASKELRIQWLEKDSKGFYREGDNDTITAGAMLCPLKLVLWKKGRWTVAEKEKRRLAHLISYEEAQGEVEDEDDSDFKTGKRKRKHRSASDVEEDESADEDEEEGDEVTKKKAKAPPRKKPRKAPGAPRARRQATGRTPRKRAVAPRKKATGGAKRGKVSLKRLQEVVSNTWTFHRPDSELNTSCCLRCTAKEALRATITNNTSLLKAMVEDTKRVYTLTEKRSADIDYTALHYAILNNNHEAIRILLEEEKKPKNRITCPSCRLVVQGTGSYSQYTYGHAVRRLSASRKGKEGNNAFACDLEDNDDDDDGYNFVKFLLQNPQITKETIELVLTLKPDLANDYLPNRIVFAIEAGNRKLAAHLIEQQVGRGDWGFNVLHKQVLSLDDADLPEAPKTASITKKPVENFTVTPLHCSAINPNPKYLRLLMGLMPDSNVLDARGRKPIHYAAACEGTKPLEHLLANGAFPNDPDKSKTTPLMLAARFGRVANLQLLLKALKAREEQQKEEEERMRKEAEEAAAKAKEEKGKEDNPEKEKDDGDEGEDEEASEGEEGGKPKKATAGRAKKPSPMRNPINLKDRHGNTALAYAVLGNCPDCVRELMKAGAVSVANANKYTPVTTASYMGYTQCLKVLLKEGHIKLDVRDRIKRTPLMLAVKNGNVEATSYLIHRGANVSAVDSSKNSVCHYAAAYGWLECLKLLVENGAEPNGVNDWKVSPLSVAMLKGHLGCAEYLLDSKDVDVNLPDDNGRTLVSQAAGTPSEQTMQQLTFLLEKKHADPNKADKNGDTPLHHLIRESKSPQEAQQEAEGGGSILSAEAFGGRRQRVPAALRKLVLRKGIRSIDEAEHSGSEEEDEDEDEDEDEGDEEEEGAIEARKKETSGVEEMTVDKEEGEKEKEPDYVVEVMKALLENGADVNAANKSGETPLLCAVVKGNIALMTLLLNNGATADYRDENGANILHVLSSTATFFDVLPVLDLLQTKKVDMHKLAVQIDDDGKAPLHSFVDLCSRFCPSLPRNLPEDQRAPYIEKQWGLACARVIPVIRKYIEFAQDVNQQVDQQKKYREMDPILLAGTPEHPAPTLSERYCEIGGYTALHIAVRNDSPVCIAMFKELMAYPSIDLSRQTAVQRLTPLCVGLHHVGAMYFDTLLRKGIPLDIVDSNGNTALMLAASRGLGIVVSTIVDVGSSNKASWKALVNMQNNGGDTALNIACQHEYLSIVEQLLAVGADPNIADKQKLAPLHYIAHSRNAKVAKLLLAAKANVNSTGSRSRTPLHLAVNASSVDDASFDIEDVLINAGADVNAVDNLGRNPLHYAFIKAGQRNVFDHSKFDPIEEVSNLCSVEELKLDMQDNWKRTPLHYASQRGATICSLLLLSRGANINQLDEDENSPLGIALLSGFPDYAIMLLQKGASAKQPVVTVEGQWKLNKEINENVYIKTSRTPTSMFRFAVTRDWQGVAYLILDTGFSYAHALHDVLLLGKLQQAHIICRKMRNFVDDSSFYKDQQQTVFHSLAQSPTQLTNWEDILMEQFLSKNVQLDAVDSHGRNVLHYCCMHEHCRFLAMCLARKVPVNVIDKNGKNPLHYALEGDRIKTVVAGPWDTGILSHLAEFKVDPNVVYIECERKSAGTTLLIRAVRKHFVNTIGYLLSALHADPNLPDNFGMTAAIYAVCKNDKTALEKLLEFKPDLTPQDNLGKTVLHYAVCPLDYGSYENVELLNLLVANGAPLDTKDNKGCTALHYASVQEDHKMYGMLQKAGAAEEPAPPTLVRRAPSALEVWPPGLDFEKDAQELLDQVVSKKPEPGPPDVDHIALKTLNETVNVYVDKKGVVYDVLLTRVDIKNGKFGTNMFYKMQVLFDRVKEIYILWNRWGRVGEKGQHQQTAFNDLDEVTKEFQSIFKSKTGNLWDEPFEKHPNKYSLVVLDHTAISVQEVLKPFDKDEPEVAKAGGVKYPPSSLPKPLLELMQMLANVTSLTKAMKQSGINTEMIPVEKLRKQTLIKANEVLLSLKEKIVKHEELISQAKLDVNKIRDSYAEIVELSNQFYELVPHGEFRNCPMEPISELSAVSTKLQLIHNLINMELASKILLGAQACCKVVNPFDYCLKALNLHIEPVDHKSTEFKLLRRYAQNTNSGSDIVVDIFRVERRGEVERFAPFKDSPNRYLLWHGSSISNFMGILTTGLRIAPIEAEASGYRFGKGVYFADMLMKSVGYCGSSDSGGMLLLCDVALGNMNYLWHDEYMTEPPAGFDSCKALGSTAPDWSDSIIFPNGVRVPRSMAVQQEAPKDKYFCTSHNEFIVYTPDRVQIRYLVRVNC